MRSMTRVKDADPRSPADGFGCCQRGLPIGANVAGCTVTTPPAASPHSVKKRATRASSGTTGRGSGLVLSRLNSSL